MVHDDIREEYLQITLLYVEMYSSEKKSLKSLIDVGID